MEPEHSFLRFIRGRAHISRQKLLSASLQCPQGKSDLVSPTLVWWNLEAGVQEGGGCGKSYLWRWQRGTKNRADHPQTVLTSHASTAQNFQITGSRQTGQEAGIHYASLVPKSSFIFWPLGLLSSQGTHRKNSEASASKSVVMVSEDASNVGTW